MYGVLGRTLIRILKKRRGPEIETVAGLGGSLEQTRQFDSIVCREQSIYPHENKGLRSCF
jgi:hypothetical protein